VWTEKTVNVFENRLLKTSLDWLTIIGVPLARRNLLNEELHYW
jgi:hypothetical protein